MHVVVGSYKLLTNEQDVILRQITDFQICTLNVFNGFII